MKLYTYRRAPSPRRVALYLAEKKLVLPTVEVDVAAGRTSAMHARDGVNGGWEA